MAKPPNDPVRRIHRRSPAHPRRNPLPGPRQNPNRDALHNPAPVLPQMELRHIVSPHQPHKPYLRVKRAHLCKGLRRVPRAQMRLDIRHFNTRMLHHFPRPRHTQVQRRRPARFQRVARTDHPPHPIQPEPFQRLTRDMRMTIMRRIKRPTKQPDHLTRGRIWKLVPHNPPSHRYRARDKSPPASLVNANHARSRVDLASHPRYCGANLI